MISALAIAAVLQAMTQAEMVAEGEDIGRSAAVMGACSRFGYTTYPAAVEQWDDDFMARAAVAGWSQQVAASAISMGSAAELAALDMQGPTDSMTDAQVRRLAVDTISRIKARCRQLANDHAGLIGGLEQGDRNADAQLAIMLRPVD